ncbi:MAG: hypothetical protein AAGF24_14205 [Cyanobacteria bacterium P01_H01_bin.121]
MPESSAAASTTTTSASGQSTGQLTDGLAVIATFRISPLIRLTLLSLYIALTLPLPVLADVTQAPVSPKWLAFGLVMGWLLLYAALTEQVVVRETEIQVTYPRWLSWLWRRGWTLAWNDVKSLKPRTTGQGGLVYYFLSNSGEGYLLPMRIAGFARLVRIVEQKTGIDTRDVKPLAQPWMYLILFSFTVLLLLIDAWVIWTAASLPLPLLAIA